MFQKPSVAQAFAKINELGFKIAFDITNAYDKGSFMVEPNEGTDPIIGCEEAYLIADNICDILVKATPVRVIKIWYEDEEGRESICSYSS